MKSVFANAKLIILSLLLLLQVFLTGCGTVGNAAKVGAGATVGVMGAGMAIEVVRDLLLKGIEGIDEGQSNVSMHPSAPSKLSKAKKIAVLLQSPNAPNMPAMPWGSGGKDVLEDTLAGLLMQMGYEIIVGSDVATKQQADTQANLPTRLQIAKELGADLLLSGSVDTAMSYDMKTGMFLGRNEMRMASVINAASLRITDSNTDRLIMSVTVAYKKGKSPLEVAKDLSTILDRARHSA